jgi:hypothetical protein
MRSHSLPAALSAALLLAACQDHLPEGGPVGPAAAASESSAPGSLPLIDPLEIQFAEIESSVPGFAGWYFDRDGSAVVRVKDAGRQAEALERVGRFLDTRGQAGRGPAAAHRGRPRMSARPAAWSFSELARVRQTIRENMPEGVTRLDLDEVSNVVEVGVSDEQAAQRFRGEAARLGIPGAAVRVSVVAAAESRADLRSYQRPIRAGLAHTFKLAGLFRYCAIGANGAWSNNESYSGYFTASHCSEKAFSRDYGVYYQPDSTFPIGTEMYDPAPQASIVCPTDAVCRRSDALFVRYDAGVRSSSGKNTLFSVSAGTEINGFYTISGPVYNVPIGEVLDKIGPTSGRTSGPVTATCVDKRSDRSWNGKTVWLLCNTEAGIHSRAGDSGSTIFKWYGAGQPVQFAGMLWGGPRFNQDVSFFSTVYNIEYEFPSYTFWY